MLPAKRFRLSYLAAEARQTYKPADNLALSRPVPVTFLFYFLISILTEIFWWRFFFDGDFSLMEIFWWRFLIMDGASDCFEIRKQTTQQGVDFVVFNHRDVDFVVSEMMGTEWLFWDQKANYTTTGADFVVSEMMWTGCLWLSVLRSESRQGVDFVVSEMIWTVLRSESKLHNKVLILLYQRWYGQGDCLFWNQKVNCSTRHWFCWWERVSIAGWFCWCISYFMEILFLWSLSDMPIHIVIRVLCVHPNFYKIGEKQSDQAFLIQG